MKLLPMLLVNVVTAVAAVLVYDTLRSEPAAPAFDDSRPGIEWAVVESRVARLEAARAPQLEAQAPETVFAQRLAALEQRVEALAARGLGTARPAVPGREPSAAGVGKELPPRLPGLDSEFSAEEVQRFRALRAAAQRAERLQHDRDRIQAVLTTAGITLNDEQKERLVAAHAEFESRRDEIWREVKTRIAQGGPDVDWKPVIEETRQRVHRELVGRLEAFLPSPQAETIAGALHRTGK